MYIQKCIVLTEGIAPIYYILSYKSIETLQVSQVNHVTMNDENQIGAMSWTQKYTF